MQGLHAVPRMLRAKKKARPETGLYVLLVWEVIRRQGQR
jgi:hypothetical protein